MLCAYCTLLNRQTDRMPHVLRSCLPRTPKDCVRIRSQFHIRFLYGECRTVATKPYLRLSRAPRQGEVCSRSIWWSSPCMPLAIKSVNCGKYAGVRFSRRHRFFTTIEILNNYQFFENWQHLLHFVGSPRSPP